MIRALAQEGFESWVLVEGDARTLEFLGKLFLLVAADADCGWEMAPSGPGSIYFAKGSEFGLSIYRLPCVNDQLTDLPRAGGGVTVWLRREDFDAVQIVVMEGDANGQVRPN